MNIRSSAIAGVTAAAVLSVGLLASVALANGSSAPVTPRTASSVAPVSDDRTPTGTATVHRDVDGTPGATSAPDDAATHEAGDDSSASPTRAPLAGSTRTGDDAATHEAGDDAATHEAGDDASRTSRPAASTADHSSRTTTAPTSDGTTAPAAGHDAGDDRTAPPRTSTATVTVTVTAGGQDNSGHGGGSGNGSDGHGSDG